ncbi:hypothetical protein PGT21_031719 [Puccinia graminis f. sp. tritici]|uniref:Uncharacterized protein n=1 Tax=Puccinia graminis f. sp. tritici TaxID=56615 RepID=A0A5B0N5R3_PUCGR|nr:hypothetical protein PGT21_031719 [Puccinia graminis f. sp. tritici]
MWYAKKGEKLPKNNGLAYHDEWTQSHSSWTNNHRSFYITLRDVYGKGIFAEKLRIHKENCDAISDIYGFMTAFRYDMQIRMNAFAHRVPSKDGAAVPDISVKQLVVIEQCYSIVRSYGEASWKDNMYAPGASHASYDPDTGTKRPELTKSASYPINNHQQGTGSAGRGNHQERRKEKRWNNQNHGWGHGYNYFQPNGDHHNPSFSQFNHGFMNSHSTGAHDNQNYRQYSGHNNYGYNLQNNASSSNYIQSNQGNHYGPGEGRKRFRGNDNGGKGAGKDNDPSSGGKQ